MTALGLVSYLVAMAEADLRFVPCHGYFQLDAATGYCRQPGYLAWAGMAFFGIGAVTLFATAVSRLFRKK